MIIKIKKTRISLWLNGKRFSKIEPNALIITHGYSKTDKHLWNRHKFDKIHDCLVTLEMYLILVNNTIKPSEKQFIKLMYNEIY